MNKLDKQYTDLLQDILDNGVVKSDRTGTGTISIFGRQIRHKMSDGFPLLTTKKMPFKTIVTELLWFLRGDTNIKYLVDNGCHIWDGDAYKNFIKTYEGRDGEIILPPDDYINDNGELISKEEFINKIKTDDEFAKQWGELGPIYGKQWRNWCGYERIPVGWNHGSPITFKEVPKCDQIQNLINDLKTNPDSRRLMVNAWNVGELNQMVLPPCHYGFQVYTRELSLEERLQVWNTKFGFANEEQKNQFDHNIHLDTHGVPTRAISLMFNMRSIDTFLGLPFNIASYGLLLEIIAKAVNMVPNELIGNLGDVHLYSNHIEQAKEQIGREFTEKEIQEHLQESGMDALMEKPRMEYISKLPKRTRQPFPLPTLKHMKTEAFFKSLSEDVSLVTHLDNTDFEIENYQSHPSIKAPLSN